MMTCVQYENDTFGYVDGLTLDGLLLGETLRRIHRPSEERWVNFCNDPFRG